MNVQQQIDKLNDAITILKKVQESCPHKWGEPYQDYKTTKTPIHENRPQGSDFFNPVLVGWKNEKSTVWKRECTNCGLLQETTHTEAVIARYKPVFK